MTLEALADLHGRCFALPAPWSAAAFAGLMADPQVFACGDARGFIMGRVVAGEAELLTLAVAPEARRQGRATQLLREFLAESTARAGETAFLEVAADNDAAISLYLAAGFAQAGRRRDYYAPGLDALILTRALGTIKS